MPKAIPERQPLGDPFAGVVLQLGQHLALAAEPQPTTTTLARGVFVVRYAVRFLGKTHFSIVPGLVVLDYGDILTGADAWNFLLMRSHLHPRAEVVGYRSDGTDDMVFVRQLDLAQPVEVLVYADSTATKPIARPTALIAPPTAAYSGRLLDYLPRYDSLEAWQLEMSV